jgi:hypothetical protein
VTEDAGSAAERRQAKRRSAREASRAAKESARLEAERTRREVEAVTNDPEVQQESIRQDNIMYGGLIGLGVVMVQPFLTAGSVDRLATVCVVAWAVAIPLLAALMMVNRHETFRRRRADSRLVAMARVSAMLAAAVGMVTGFWNIHWAAGAAFLTAAFVAIGVHSAGFTRLEYRRRKGPAKALMDDKKVHKDLRTAAESLRDASDQLRGKREPALIGGWFGFQFILTLYLQQVRGWSALETGVAIFRPDTPCSCRSRSTRATCSRCSRPSCSPGSGSGWPTGR